MVARARKTGETYKNYRKSLKVEAREEKARLLETRTPTVYAGRTPIYEKNKSGNFVKVFKGKPFQRAVARNT